MWVVALFYVLGDTADTYFCPVLARLSTEMGLSPNLAGITFLALGNGAPDIASILIASFQGSAQISYGEPLGAGVFVTTAVTAAVVHEAHAGRAEARSGSPQGRKQRGRRMSSCARRRRRATATGRSSSAP